MSAAKHTPGPWRVGTPGPNGCHTVGTKQGLMTAMVAHSINSADQREQAIADAHLIAAAPDLLQELVNIATADPSKWDEETRGQFREWAQNRARAAIAKATGEAA